MDTQEARAQAPDGYTLKYPLTLTTLADYLACDIQIWPICHCGWRPPLDLVDLIRQYGQRQDALKLARKLPCSTCGGSGEIKLTAGRVASVSA